MVGGALDVPYVGRGLELFVDDVLPVLSKGFVYGSLAFAVGFGLLWGAVDYVNPSVGGIVGFLLDLANVTLPEPKLLAGWAFYMAHGVELTVPTTFGYETRNFLAGGTGRVLFLYPPLLLVIAGAAAARTEREFVSGAIVGGSIAVGYALPFLAVLEHLVWTQGIPFRTLTIALTPGPSFELRAVGYPLVFGGLGGLAAVAFDRPLVSRFR